MSTKLPTDEELTENYQNWKKNLEVERLEKLKRIAPGYSASSPLLPSKSD